MDEGPGFLEVIGHPLRWRLLRELSRSDRRVHELTGLLGEAQNTVSYHLGRLRRAGLVSARRSSADGRDSYYAADLTRIGTDLAATGAALHPGLRLVPSTRQTDRADARVLFLCTGNSARSPIAEALTTSRSGGAVVARSAGSHPKPLHPDAARAMREVHGIDLTDHLPTHVEDVLGERFDRVVTLCDRVREVCPELPGATAVHWSIPDPTAGGAAGGETYPAFLAVVAELERRIDFLLADLAMPSAEPIPA